MNILKLKNLLDNYEDLGLENWILLRELLQSPQGLKIEISSEPDVNDVNVVPHASGLKLAPTTTVPFSWVIGDGVSFNESSVSVKDIEDGKNEPRLMINKPKLLNYGVTYTIEINGQIYIKDKNKSFKSVFSNNFHIPQDSVIIIKEKETDSDALQNFEEMHSLSSSSETFFKLDESTRQFFQIFSPKDKEKSLVEYLFDLKDEQKSLLNIDDNHRDIGFLCVVREYLNEIQFNPNAATYILSRFNKRKEKELKFNQDLRKQLKMEEK